MIRPLTEQVCITTSEIRGEMTDYLAQAAYEIRRGDVRDVIHSLIQLAEDAARNARELTESLDAEEQK